MFKKTSAAMKNYMSFFLDVSSILREKSKRNRGKITKNGFVHKNRQRIHVWNVFFHYKVDLLSIFRVPLGPRGPPGTSRAPSRSLQFFINFQSRLNTGQDQPPGGPREAPGVPQAPPGHHFGSILDRFFGLICLSRDGSDIDFSGHCDDSEGHDDIREDLWKYRGILSEVAWKLPVIAMPCALSCWFFPRVQAM